MYLHNVLQLAAVSSCSKCAICLIRLLDHLSYVEGVYVLKFDSRTKNKHSFSYSATCKVNDSCSFSTNVVYLYREFSIIALIFSSGYKTGSSCLPQITSMLQLTLHFVAILFFFERLKAKVVWKQKHFI